MQLDKCPGVYFSSAEGMKSPAAIVRRYCDNSVQSPLYCQRESRPALSERLLAEQMWTFRRPEASHVACHVKPVIVAECFTCQAAH